MARIRNRTNERHENMARVANQAAETALCHYAHLNGVRFSDEDFDAQQATMRNAILEQLHRVEHAATVALYDPQPLVAAEPRAYVPRSIPAVRSA